MAFEDIYKNYTESGAGQTISDMYNAQRQAQLSGLESAYNRNLSDLQASRERIGKTYQTGANDLSTQYERNRRNLNIQAAANGINTGTGSQQRLALQSAYNRDFGALRGREAADYAEADRGINNLTQAYQSDVNSANANADFQLNQALLQGYQNDYNQRLQQAQILASYGNFSGFKSLGYTDKQIKAMQKTWIAQNPQLAYNAGVISRAEYARLMGGSIASSGGGYSRGNGIPNVENNGGDKGNGGDNKGTPPPKGLTPPEQNPGTLIPVGGQGWIPVNYTKAGIM